MYAAAEPIPHFMSLHHRADIVQISQFLVAQFNSIACLVFSTSFLLIPIFFIIHFVSHIQLNFHNSIVCCIAVCQYGKCQHQAAATAAAQNAPNNIFIIMYVYNIYG